MMLVREALITDAAAVAAIYNESIAAGDSTMELSEKSADDLIDRMGGLGPSEKLLVLEDDGMIQGWGILKKYSDREGYRLACETSVFLRRELVGRRTGHGSALQSELLRIAKELGYHHVVVKIWAGNAISIRMHQKFGFETVGTQREIGFVNGTWQDVTIMQLVLS
jgi:phosphinothricin acetyltransferase